MRSQWIAGLTLTLSLVGTEPLAAQTGMSLEITGSAGYTQVDADKWAGTSANDWTQFASGFSAKLFLKGTPGGKIGIEAGWQYLMWYQINNPFAPPPYLERDVSASHYTLLYRFTALPTVNLDLGAGVYMFDGFNDVALHFAASKNLFPGPKLSIPVGIRVDPILDSEAKMVPISAFAGVGIKF